MDSKKSMIRIRYLNTPYGELIIGSCNDRLCLCDWRFRKSRKKIDKRLQSGLQADYRQGNSAIIDKTQAQLTEYFMGNRVEFDIPLLLVGSDFQKSVWNELLKIPYGKTETYSGLAKIMGNEEAIRAIASANGANAISIIVPCHRIIGRNGDLVGYAGGLPVKKKLLQLEDALADNQLSIF
jgi:methylated-DNA-[protein]-cysteine S-methyltransferase